MREIEHTTQFKCDIKRELLSEIARSSIVSRRTIVGLTI